jgi:type I restriction enzyme S subunit
MKSNWTPTKLKDFVNINPRRSVKKGTTVPFFAMTELTEGVRDIPSFMEKEFGSGTKFINGDTIFARITPCLENGKTALVSTVPYGEVGAGSTEFIVLNPKNLDTDKYFVYYLARLPELREYAKKKMEGTSGRQRVSAQSLGEFEFLLPPPETRKDIGRLLAYLDDKISSNTQMNQTLEKIAQRIFKSWVIDFDPVKANAKGVPFDELSPEIQAMFPSELIESEMGLIPKGWQSKNVGDISRVQSGKRPPTKSDKKTNDDHIPVWGGNGVKWYSKEANKKGPFIITGRVGTLGTVFRVYDEVWVSDNAITIDPENSLHFEVIYRAMLTYDINSLNSGSTQPLVTQTAIKSIPVLVPNNEVCLEYQKITKSLLDKIYENNKQNDVLKEIRDKLLPKLISGSIEVSDETEQSA